MPVRRDHHFGHAVTREYKEHFGRAVMGEYVAVTGEYMAREPTAGAGGTGEDHANDLYWPTNSTAELEGGGSTLYPEIAALDFLAAWKEREKVRKQVEKDRKRARKKSLIMEMQEAKKRNDLQSAVPLLLKANDLFRRADTIDVPDDAAEPDAA